MITADDIRQNIEALEQQRDQALATYQQALGALQFAHAMLKQLETSDLTVEQFAEMIGGNGATATISALDDDV